MFTTRFFSFLILFGLLLFSMGAAGYVIFFRTTVAHGASQAHNWADIVFEEPYPVIPELPPDLQPDGASSLPMVAIIIDDMGYHEKIGSQLLALPINLTFSFLPSAPFTPELEEQAFQTGRVVLLHLPMEPKSKEWDPGQGALLTGQDRNQQKALFYQNLQGVPHAVGMNNHMGSLYTENRAVMADLMELVHAQGMFYVDSFTTAASQGLAAARAANVPAARRHIFLDNVHSPDKVCKQLEKLVLSAEKEGWAIGIGHPNEATLSALTTCRGKFMERVRLVSAQELVMKLNSGK
ncbi:MAG: divergent polysaccharide deacetylase family protein [Proteobacteria bacterium]|nr:divergent polysaccharide deacetylase family protein [Pseudomonadota bacterium]